MSHITIIGILASIGTGTSLLPQLIKIIKEKKADDISLVMLVVLFTGLGLWVYYGILKKDWIIIISNAFSLVVNICIVLLTLRYKKKM
jgi:MtN3 and saliva related transmembrane protein